MLKEIDGFSLRLSRNQNVLSADAGGKSKKYENYTTLPFHQTITPSQQPLNIFIYIYFMILI